MHTLLYATQKYEVLVSEAKIKNTLIVICILLQCIHYYQGVLTTKPNGGSLDTCSGVRWSNQKGPKSLLLFYQFNLCKTKKSASHRYILRVVVGKLAIS